MPDTSPPQVPAERKPSLLSRNWWFRFLAIVEFLAGGFLLDVALNTHGLPVQFVVGVLAAGCLAGAFTTLVLTEG